MVARPDPGLRPGRSRLEGVAVTRFRRRHLRDVLAIERQVYPRPWSPGLFTHEITRRDNRRYVVAVGPRPRPAGRRPVVGYAGVLLQVDEAHITTVAVHPRYHRRGVASRLLHAVLTAARDLGAESATLEVRVANRGAQRLYEQFGFADVGIRPGYYAETGEDALVMWAHDLQGAEMTARLERQAARFRGLVGRAR